jgi:hypothetical protein
LPGRLPRERPAVSSSSWKPVITYGRTSRSDPPGHRAYCQRRANRRDPVTTAHLAGRQRYPPRRSEELVKDGYRRTLQARAICRNQGRDHGRGEPRKDQPTRA